MTGFIKDLIIEQLRKYCHVDENKLQLSVFGGTGSLDHVVIKPEAFSHLDLPITISRAVIKHIEFDIPWTSLKSKPVVAKVNGVYACVTPPPVHLTEKEKVERLERARKALLDAFDQSRKNAFILAQEAKSGKEKEEDEGFASRLVEIIINNLMVELSNVHLRYECKHSEGSGVPHTIAGFTLSGVKLQSCNSSGDIIFCDPSQTTSLYKKVSLSGLRLYSEVHHENMTPEKVKSDHLLAQDFATMPVFWSDIMSRQLDDTNAQTQASTIFGPVSGTAKVSMVQKKFITKHKNMPYIAVDVAIKNVAAAWSRRQYLSVVRAGIEMSEATARLEKLVAPDQHEELWDEYELLYSKHVLHTETGPDKKRLEEIEKVMPGEPILRCRKNVFKQVKMELAKRKKKEEERLKRALEERERERKRLEEENKKKSQGFFSGLFGSSPTPAGKTEKELKEETAAQEKQIASIESEFHISEGEDDLPDLTDLPPEYEWYKVNLEIPDVSVKLNLNEDEEDSHSKSSSSSSTCKFVAPCKAELAGTSFKFCKYHKKGSLAVDLKSKTLSVTNPTKSREKLPEIIFVDNNNTNSSSQQQKQITSAAGSGGGTTTKTYTHLLQVQADVKPLKNTIKDTTIDLDVNVKLAPLHIVVDPILLTCIGNFFQVPSKAKIVTDTIGRSAMVAAASEASKVAASSLRHSVTDSLSDQQTMRLTVDAAAPVVFLPFSVAQLADNSPMLCASLGHFTLGSSPPTDDIKKRRTAEITQAVASRKVAELKPEILFEKFVANMKGIAVAYCCGWGKRAIFLSERLDMKIASRSSTSFFFLPPLKLDCEISTPLIPGLEEFVPPVIIDAKCEDGLHVRSAHDSAGLVVTKLAKPWMDQLEQVTKENEAAAHAVVVASPRASASGSEFSSPVLAVGSGAADIANTDFNVLDDVANHMNKKEELLKAPLKHEAKVKFVAQSFQLELVDDQTSSLSSSSSSGNELVTTTSSSPSSSSTSAGTARFILQAAPISLDLVMSNKKMDVKFHLEAFSLFDTLHRSSGGGNIIPPAGLHVLFLQDNVKNEMNIDINFSDELQLAVCQPLIDFTDRALSFLPIVSVFGGGGGDSNDNNNHHGTPSSSSTSATPSHKLTETPRAGGEHDADYHYQYSYHQDEDEEHGMNNNNNNVELVDEKPEMFVKLHAPAVAVALYGSQYSDVQCFRMAIEDINVTFDATNPPPASSPASSTSSATSASSSSSFSPNASAVAAWNLGSSMSDSQILSLEQQHDNEPKQEQKIHVTLSKMTLTDKINNVPVITSAEIESNSTSSPKSSSKWFETNVLIAPDGKHMSIVVIMNTLHVVAFAPTIEGVVKYATDGNGILACFLAVFKKNASDIAEASVQQIESQRKQKVLDEKRRILEEKKRVLAEKKKKLLEAKLSAAKTTVEQEAIKKKQAEEAEARKQAALEARKKRAEKRKKLEAEKKEREGRDDSLMHLDLQLNSVSVSLLSKSDRSPIFHLALNRACVEMQQVGKDYYRTHPVPETEEELLINSLLFRAGELNLRDSRTKKTLYPNLISTVAAVAPSPTSASSGSLNSSPSPSPMKRASTANFVMKKTASTTQQEEIEKKKKQDFIVFTKMPASSASSASFDEEITLNVNELVVVYTPVIISYIVSEVQGVVNSIRDTETSRAIDNMSKQFEEASEEAYVPHDVVDPNETESERKHRLALEEELRQKKKKKQEEEAAAAAALAASAKPLKLLVDMKAIRLKAVLDPESESCVEVTPGSLSVRNELIKDGGRFEKISVVMSGTQVVVFGYSILQVSDDKIQCAVSRKNPSWKPSLESNQENSSTSSSEKVFDMDVSLKLDAPIVLNLSAEQYEFILKLAGDTLRAGEELEIPDDQAQDHLSKIHHEDSIAEGLDALAEQQEEEQANRSAAAATGSVQRANVAVLKSSGDEESGDYSAKEEMKENPSSASHFASSPSSASYSSASAAAAGGGADQKAAAAAKEAPSTMRLNVFVKVIDVKLLDKFCIGISDIAVAQQSLSETDSTLNVNVGGVFLKCAHEDVLTIEPGTSVKIKNKEVKLMSKRITGSDLAVDVPRVTVHARGSTIHSVMSDVVEPANRLLLNVKVTKPIVHLNQSHCVVLEKDTIIDSKHPMLATAEGTGIVHFCLDLNQHSLTLHPDCFVRGTAPSAEQLVTIGDNCMVEVINGVVRVPRGFCIHSWVGFGSGSKLLLLPESCEIAEMPWKSTSLVVSSLVAGATGGNTHLQDQLAQAQQQLQSQRQRGKTTTSASGGGKQQQQEEEEKKEASAHRWKKAGAFAKMKAMTMKEEHEIHSVISVNVRELQFFAHSETTSSLPLQQISLERVSVSMKSHNDFETQRPLLSRIEVKTPLLQSTGNEDGGNCIELLPSSLSLAMDGTDHQKICVNLPNLQVATRISRALVLVDELDRLSKVISPKPREDVDDDQGEEQQQPGSPNEKKKSKKQQKKENFDGCVHDSTITAESLQLQQFHDTIEPPALMPAVLSVTIPTRRSLGAAASSSSSSDNNKSKSNKNKSSSSAAVDHTAGGAGKWAASSLSVEVNMSSLNILAIGVVNNSFAEVMAHNAFIEIEVVPTLSVKASLLIQAAVFNPTPAAWERILEATAVKFALSTANGENAISIETGDLDLSFSPGLMLSLMALTGTDEGSVAEKKKKLQEKEDQLALKRSGGVSATSAATAAAGGGGGGSSKEDLASSFANAISSVDSIMTTRNVEIINYTADDIKIHQETVSAVTEKEKQEEQKGLQPFVARHRSQCIFDPQLHYESRNNKEEGDGKKRRKFKNSITIQFFRPTNNVPLNLNLARNSISWLGEHVVELSVQKTQTRGEAGGGEEEEEKRIVRIIPVHRRQTENSRNETIVSVKSYVSDCDCELLGVGQLAAGRSLFVDTATDFETHFVLRPTRHRVFTGVFPPADTSDTVFPLTFRRIIEGFSTKICSKNISHQCWFRIQSKHRGMLLGIPHFEISILGGLTLTNDLPWPLSVGWQTKTGARSSIDIKPHGSTEVTMLRGSNEHPLNVSVEDLNEGGGRFFKTVKPHHFHFDPDLEEEGGADTQMSRVFLKEEHGCHAEMTIRSFVHESNVRFFTPFILCNNTSIPLNLVGTFDKQPEKHEKRNYYTARPRRPSGLCLDPLPGLCTQEKGSDNENELFLFVSFGDMTTQTAVPFHTVGTPGVIGLESGQTEEVFHLGYSTFFADQSKCETRTIVITPRWVIVNRLPFPVRIGQDCDLERPTSGFVERNFNEKLGNVSGKEKLAWSPRHAKRICAGEASEAYNWTLACKAGAGKAKLQSPAGGDSKNDDDADDLTRPVYIAVVARDDITDDQCQGDASSPNFVSRQTQAQWKIYGRSPASFTIDSSSTWPLCIPTVGQSNAQQLIHAEADVTIEGYYSYVTLRLPRQPSVLVINRLSTTVSIEDVNLASSSQSVKPHTQTGALTLPPNAELGTDGAADKKALMSPEERKKEEERERKERKKKNKEKEGSGENVNKTVAWNLMMKLPSCGTLSSKASFARAEAVAEQSTLFALDLFSGFAQQAGTTTTSSSSSSSSATAAASGDAKGFSHIPDENAIQSPLSPPHAASPILLNITPDVQLVLTRGVGGQRIVTISPLDNNNKQQEQEEEKHEKVGRSQKGGGDSKREERWSGAKSKKKKRKSRFVELCQPVPLDFSLDVKLPSISLSLYNRAVEVAKIVVSKLSVEITRQCLNESYSLTIQDLQVENMSEAKPKYELGLFVHTKQEKPAVFIELKKKTNTAPRFLDITSFIVDIQPLIIQVGDRFLLSFYRFVQRLNPDADKKYYHVPAPSPTALFEEAPQTVAHSIMDSTLVVDDLFINPIAIRVWLNRQRDSDIIQEFNLGGLVSMLAMPLNDVGIVADGVAIHSRQDSASQMAKYLQDMYIDKLKIKFLGLGLQYLGAIPIIGAPAKFLHTLGGGVTRFVVEPVKDVKSPSERAAAFAKGGAHMVGGVIGGSLGLVSDVTRGGARVAQIAGGTTGESDSKVPGLVTGIFKGITGIVTKPIEGAINHGAKGFFKGVGTGILGVVADPVAGVLSDVSKVTGSMAAILTDKALPDLKRSRMPRGFTATGGGVRPDRVIEIYEYQRLDGDHWTSSTVDGTPWRDRRGKEAAKAVLEEEVNVQLQMLLSTSGLVKHVDPTSAASSSSSGSHQHQQQQKQNQKPDANELRLAAQQGYKYGTTSPFAKLWQIDRYSTNLSGWQYSKVGGETFVATQSSKRTIRRRRWCITLPLSISSSANNAALTESQIRRHVMGQSSGLLEMNKQHLWMHAVARRSTQLGQAAVFPPPPGCPAWVVEVIENERNYIFGWSTNTSSMFGDPPGISSRDHIVLPDRNDKFFKQLPMGFEWKTEWWSLGTRYGTTFASETWTEDRGIKACRRTIWRRVCALQTTPTSSSSSSSTTTTAAASQQNKK